MTVVEYLKGEMETLARAWASIVGSFKSDPEFRGTVYMIGIFIVVMIFFFIDSKLSERVSYIIKGEDGYHHAMYSRRWHKINFAVVRIEATILFVLMYFALYVRWTDLFWFLFLSLLFEWIMKSQLLEWENDDRRDHRRAARDFNQLRDDIELDRVMRFCDPKDPEDGYKLRSAIVSIQEYRRRTGRLGDIKCAEPSSDLNAE